MAEHAVNSVTSAVTSELTSRVFSGLIQRYGKDAATSEKLQRLEMLLIKIHSAIEASEKLTIENSWLLRWRDKLKKAASRGDKVLARFLQQAKDAPATSNADANQHQGEAASYPAAAPSRAVSALSFTRKSMSGIVQGICNARKMLFSSVDDDMERLDRTLGSLEKLSPDIGEFIRLLHLEALPKVEQTPYSTALSTEFHEPTKMGEREKKRMKSSTANSNPSSPSKEDKVESLDLCFRCISGSLGPAPFPNLESDSAVVPKEQQFMLLQLQDRLEAAFTEICNAVELVDNRDLEDMKWLAYWVGILREAKEQGCDALGTTSTCKTVNTEDSDEPSSVEYDREEDELCTFVHRLEDLASDVEYFSKLVYLCPTK